MHVPLWNITAAIATAAVTDLRTLLSSAATLLPNPSSVPDAPNRTDSDVHTHTRAHWKTDPVDSNNNYTKNYTTNNNNNYSSKSRIAFGSCNRQDRRNDFWPILLERQPSAFVWGGDAIYADAKNVDGKPLVCGDTQTVRRLYRQQLQVPGYRALLQHNISVFGTIDDHDYGCNNADRTFPHKHGNTRAFVIDFLRLRPQSSAMARRADRGYGVYGVQLYDFNRTSHPLVPEHEALIDPDAIVEHNRRGRANITRDSATSQPFSDRTVAVFVLDVRTNKDQWQSALQTYLHGDDPEGDFLGQRQWQWFQQAVRNSPATVNVVVNGLQVQADVTPNPNDAESWTRFPTAQRRLFDTILSSSAAPLLITGDVHMTQLMKMECASPKQPQRRPVIELTTSGMTHSWGTLTNPKIILQNNRTVPDPSFRHTWLDRIEYRISAAFMHFLHHLLPWKSLVIDSDKGRQYSLQKNVGELEFDWDRNTVTVRTIGDKRQTLVEQSYSIDTLRYGYDNGNGISDDNDNDTPSKYLTQKDFDSQPGGEWTCLPYRGTVSYSEVLFWHIVGVTCILSAAATPFVLLAVALWMIFRCLKRNLTTTTATVISAIDDDDDSASAIPMPTLKPVMY